MKVYKRFMVLGSLCIGPSIMGSVSSQTINDADIYLLGAVCSPINRDEAFLKVEIRAEKLAVHWSVRGWFYGVSDKESTSIGSGASVFSMNECLAIRSHLLFYTNEKLVSDAEITAKTFDNYEEIRGMCWVRRTGDVEPCDKGSRLVSRTKRWISLIIDQVKFTNVSID